MIFGILGIALLFIPVIGGITALIAAILTLVVGYKESQDRDHPWLDNDRFISCITGTCCCDS